MAPAFLNINEAFLNSTQNAYSDDIGEIMDIIVKCVMPADFENLGKV